MDLFGSGTDFAEAPAGACRRLHDFGRVPSVDFSSIFSSFWPNSRRMRRRSRRSACMVRRHSRRMRRDYPTQVIQTAAKAAPKKRASTLGTAILEIEEPRGRILKNDQ